MKVVDAGAVVLIIGGVMVGPIESMTAPGWDWTDTLECMWNRATKKGLIERSPPCWLQSLEPIAKTCERAMREIGAFPAPPEVPPGFRMEDESKASPWGDWRLMGGEKVLCIPAPSGLVR